MISFTLRPRAFFKMKINMDYKKLFLAVVGALTIMLVGFGFASGLFYLTIHVPYVIGPLAALAIFYFITRSLYRSIRVEEKEEED